MNGRSSSAHARFRFDEFELDVAARQLRRAGRTVTLGEQALTLLEQLVRHAGEDVSHEAIHARVWPGVSVNDGSLRHAIWELRQALGDPASAGRYVRTMRGRGYRFVASVAAVDASTPVVPLARAPRRDFVGRGDELGRLCGALEGAVAGTGRACVLRGAPGIGKSRLARELMEAATLRGVTCLESSAERDAEHPPFWPWTQIFRRFLSDTPADARTRFLTQVPSVAGMLQPSAAGSGLHAPFTAGADLHRLHLFEELSALLGLIAREQPLLLLLEDIQWFDEASVAFLRYCAGTLPRLRVLLVATSRDAARRDNRPLALAVDALKRAPLNMVLELPPLTLDEIATLLIAHGMTTMTPDLAAQVHAITRGNPLFTLEIARLIGRRSERGEVALEPADCELRGVIRQRLDDLPEPCRDAVMAASVWGDACGLVELAALLRAPDDQVLEQVDESVLRGILVERAPFRFGFSHPLVQEVAYESLARTDRIRLHRLAAEHLERQPDSQVGHLSALAHHYFHAASAGVARQAVKYAALCAEQAIQTTAFETALKKYEQALTAAEVVADFPPEQRLALEVGRAETMRALARDVQEVDELLLSLGDRARRLGDASLLARIAIGFGSARMVGSQLSNFALLHDPRSRALLEEALARIAPEELALRARLYSELGFTMVQSPEHAVALHQQAVALARTHGSPALIARTLMFAQWTSVGTDDYAVQRAKLDALVDHARAHAMRDVELHACHQRMVLALGNLDLIAAERDGARAQVLADLIGSERARGGTWVRRLFEAFWSGDLSEADALIDAIFASQPINVQHQAVYFTRKSALLLLRDGSAQLPAVVAQLKNLLAMMPNASTTRCSLASAYAASGLFEVARAELDDLSRDGFAQVMRLASWMGDMILLADVAVRLRCRKRAQSIFAQLAPFETNLSFAYFDALPSGPVARALAELATVFGDHTTASRLLATSRAINHKLGAHLFLQYDALAEARLLYTSRPPGWAARATALLNEVSAFATRTGTRWLADCASESFRHGFDGPIRAAAYSES